MQSLISRLCVSALILSILSCSSADGEIQKVRDAFESYRAALLKQDGETAVDLVTAGTVEMYQEYGDLAVSGDEKTVKDLSMVSRMQVLLVRHRIEPEQIMKMSGKDLFVHAVNQNWIGKEGVLRVELRDFVVRESRATAKVTVNGKVSAERYHFAKEENHWKIDLGPLMNNADQALQRMARDKGMAEDEFLFSVITTLSKRKVKDSIWRPLE